MAHGGAYGGLVGFCSERSLPSFLTDDFKGTLRRWLDDLMMMDRLYYMGSSCVACAVRPALQREGGIFFFLGLYRWAGMESTDL